MPGKLREEQLHRLVIGGREISEIDNDIIPVRNISLESLKQEIKSRLLSEPNDWMSQKDALDASESPSSNNPYVTLAQMTRQISLGEYSTWRLPVDSPADLSALDEEKSHDGDCRLVKGLGIYEWIANSKSWSPILQVGNLFSSHAGVSLLPGESIAIEHEPDANLTRIVQVSERIAEDQDASKEDRVWRGDDQVINPISNGSLSLSADQGPQGDSEHAKLTRNSTSDPFDIWTKGIEGLRAEFQTSENERVLIDQVTSDDIAWLDYASVPVVSGAAGKTEVDSYIFNSGSYKIASVEAYNDVRLVEHIKYKDSLTLSSADVDPNNPRVITLYSLDQNYIFLIYIDQTLGGGALIYYVVADSSYSTPILIAPGAVSIDACIHTSPYANLDEVRFAYLESDNTLKYAYYKVSTGVDGVETISGPTSNRGSLRIAQEGNLEPVVATREGTYNTFIYWCRKTSGTWLQDATSKNDIKGFDLSGAPGLVVVYVDKNAEGSGNGTSWRNAYTDLAQAMNSVVGYAEIWVAKGEYYPGSSASDTFLMKEGVEIYGGFSGTETSRSHRNPTKNPTILHGRGINYHVVTGNKNSVIDGFIIRNGSALGTGDDSYGPAIFNKSKAPIIRNCSMIDNEGIGAIYNKDCSVEIRECSFYSNLSKRGNGAAIFNDESAQTKVYNCVLAANTAKLGGAIYHASTATSLEIINSTFYGNMASAGDGDAIVIDGPSSTLKNSIVWGTQAAADAAIDVKGSGSLTVSYSNVIGSGGSTSWNSSFGTDGGNNIDTNPYFLNPDQPMGPDDIFATSDDGLRLTIGSPCLNAATVSVPVQYDILGNNRDPDGGFYDQGAYEGGTTGGDVKYVDPSATGANDGTTWDNAFISLSTALSSVSSGEIWVKAGTYDPGATSSSFTLPANVHVYGGFLGTEVSRDERDWSSNETILSGKVGNNYVTVGVVTGGSNSRLDGFTIKDGRSSSSGGGMKNNGISMTIANCIFKENTATTNGGAMENLGPGLIVLSNVDFISNEATANGGAIHFDSTANGALGKCFFFANEANKGGAISCQSNTLTINDSGFANNNAKKAGGGAMYINYGSGPDNIFIKTTTMFNNDVEIEEEEDPSNPGTYWHYRDGASVFVESGAPSFEGVILWNTYNDSTDRESEIYAEAGASVTLKNSDIYYPNYPIYSWTGQGVDGAYTNQGGNISRDPKFNDPNSITINDDPYGPDGLLRTDDDPLNLKNTSPCLSKVAAAGVSITDIRGTIRDPNSTGLVDMGAYEFGGVYPPIVPDPNFGMITNSKFGALIASNSGELEYQEFTWDGTTKTNVNQISLVEGDDGKVSADKEFSLTYWCSGETYKPIFHFLSAATEKIKQGQLNDAGTAVSWSDSVVTETSKSLTSRSSLDHRICSIIRQSGEKTGRFHRHHTRFGWDYGRGTGDFILSPPDPITRSIVKNTSIDVADPASHNPNGPSLVAYIKDSDDSLQVQVSTPFYNYDNWSILGPTEEEQSTTKPSPRATPMILHETSNSLWVFGGRGVNSTRHPPGFVGQIDLLSGLWKFDLTTRTWTMVTPTTTLDPRSDHSLMGTESVFYLIGGYSQIDTTLELRVYRINWVNKEARLMGNLSRGFAKAASVKIGGDLYTFGGVEQSGNSLIASDKISRLDPSTVTSGTITVETLTPTGTALPNLENPTACIGEDGSGSTVVFLHGGYDGSQLRNELYQISISGSNYTLTTISADGIRSKRSSMVFYKKNNERFLILVGGQINEDDNSPNYSDKIMLYSFSSNKWVDISPDSGESPRKTAMAGIARGTAEEFYLFGGLDDSARGVNSTLYHYDFPYIEDGVFSSESGNITKKRGSIWIQAVDTSSMKSIDQITVPNNGYTEETGTNLRLAVGFGVAGDAWIYKNGVWKAIANEDIHESGMTVLDFNAITSVGWGEKFRPGVHQSIYLLIGLSTTNNISTPTLSKMAISYQTLGSYRVLDHRTIEITMTGVRETTIKNVSSDSSAKNLQVSIMAERS